MTGGGSLTVVGTGIESTTQLSVGARAAIRAADVAFFQVADPVSELRIRSLCANARSLVPYFSEDKPRGETYREICAVVTGEVAAGKRVCLVMYGHPGFYGTAAHEVVRRVRALGLPARMLPAVSALDCLFADLGLDPAQGGLQVYEASHFLETRPPLDAGATLVLLQVGILGERGNTPTPAVAERYRALLGELAETLGPEREAVLYEAAEYPGTEPLVMRFLLGADDPPEPELRSTLCVPASA
ncbi:MAG TPA: SAM-dependent methyltransferase [Gaiellaceae bacterium]|nr:SAM-dependent methyltransferase [Gaiellaceae bacterium]